MTFNGDSYPDGVLKPGSGTLELLEESVGRSITVRYSCGVLESQIETCWYESSTEDGEYVPIVENAP